MKKCTKCLVLKPRSEFYKASGFRDGLQYNCKPCQRKAQISWRERNLERARCTDRRNKREERERDGEEETRRKWNEWYSKNSERRAAYQNARRDKRKEKAHHALAAALERGEIIKPLECSDCGEEKPLDGHHEDYDKPLEVVWLCRRCHVLAHDGVIV